jgi:hypothetical protein
MSYRKIPRNPDWCSCCIEPSMRDGEAPCPDHRGPNGERVEYTGRDVYDPAPDSYVVMEVVGKRFTGGGYDFDHKPITRIFECFGHDPRNGFWMRTLDNDEGPPYQTNISEHAVGRTFYRVQMKLGAWALLDMLMQLGRMPTDEEVAASEFKPLVKLAFPTLRQNGLVTKDCQVTERGREIHARREELSYHLYLD